MVGEVRLELTRRYRHQLLRLARLPFRHSPPIIMGFPARFVHPSERSARAGGTRIRRPCIEKRVNDGAATLLRRCCSKSGGESAHHTCPLRRRTRRVTTPLLRTAASDPAQPNQSECRRNAEDLQRVFAQLLAEAAAWTQPTRNLTRAAE